MFYRDRGDAWIDEDSPTDNFPMAHANHAAEANANRFRCSSRSAPWWASASSSSQRWLWWRQKLFDVTCHGRRGTAESDPDSDTRAQVPRRALALHDCVRPSFLLRANADPVEIGFPFQILHAIEHLAHIVGAAMARQQQEFFAQLALIERLLRRALEASDAARERAAVFERDRDRRG
jgi:hypothetical protein